MCVFISVSKSFMSLFAVIIFLFTLFDFDKTYDVLKMLLEILQSRLRLFFLQMRFINHFSNSLPLVLKKEIHC